MGTSAYHNKLHNKRLVVIFVISGQIGGHPPGLWREGGSFGSCPQIPAVFVTGPLK
jgi:hypothetical protein